MNVTELARQVKLPTKQLRELLPHLGFDIGARAIKVDGRVAQEVIKKLSSKSKREYFIRQYLEEDTPEDGGQEETTEERTSEEKEQTTNEIIIPSHVIVKDLAKQLDVEVTKLVVELMRQGVMASLNDDIDFETASIVAEDFGFTAKLTSSDTRTKDAPDVQQEVEKAKEQNKLPRPPVVVVMGHVDHGKTKLLDAIRQSDVASGESGGITQHIGAYQVTTKTKKKETTNQRLTFIDTPGHEAFSMMRSRGARLADIAILVIAADDGVQPQTIEAISHIKRAQLPFVVAINKIDRDEANQDKVKNQLAELGITPEEWGGDTIVVPISALKGTNIQGLLESLLMVCEMEKEHITADPDGIVLGTVIESHVDKGAGPVATILIRNGTLRKGERVVVSGIPGRIKNMRNWQGKDIENAGPSVPVAILGLKKAPSVGDMLKVVDDAGKNKKVFRQFKKKTSADALRADASRHHDDQSKHVVNIIMKTDVLGSLEALDESLSKLEEQGVKINCIDRGLGDINETDVIHALDAQALVLGFRVSATSEAKERAHEQKTTLKTFEVIYDFLNFIAEEASKQVGPEITRVDLGVLKIIKVFSTEKDHIIAGGKVTAGEVHGESPIELRRKNKIMARGTIKELQSGKEVVNVVAEGQEAGVKVTGIPEILVDDELIVYQEKKEEKQISF